MQQSNLISWSIPNLITINLMAFLGFLAVALIAQLLSKRGGTAANAPADNSGGY